MHININNINILYRQLCQIKMEEVGKYQSIQDRIKRLTKLQASPPVSTFNDKHELFSTKTPSGQDSQKQNMSRMNFAKKRQNSQNNLRTITTTRQHFANNQRVFQTITNKLVQNSQPSAKQGRNEFRKTSKNQYAIRRPIRESLQQSSNQWDFSNYSMRRNDSIGNVMDKSVPNIMQKYSMKKLTTEVDDSDYCKEKSLLYEGVKENTGVKRTHGFKKSQTNLLTNRQQYGNMSYRRSVDDEGIKNLVRCQVVAKEEQFVQKRKKALEAFPIQISEKEMQICQPRSRMLTKCKSGILQRIPGRIIKNK